jgi:hypothetical protein
MTSYHNVINNLRESVRWYESQLTSTKSHLMKIVIECEIARLNGQIEHIRSINEEVIS